MRAFEFGPGFTLGEEIAAPARPEPTFTKSEVRKFYEKAERLFRADLAEQVEKLLREQREQVGKEFTDWRQNSSAEFSIGWRSGARDCVDNLRHKLLSMLQASKEDEDEG